MATWMSKLIVKSPFGPIQEHMHKVHECTELVPEIVEACLAQDYPQVRELARRLSELEGEADDIKRYVREHLPRSLFMPVARSDLLHVLSSQDDVADCAEDLGVLLSMRQMEPLPEEVAEVLRRHVTASLRVVDQCADVVERLNTLVSASFAGPEAEQVVAMMDELDELEHDADKVQDQLAKVFFKHEDDFKPGALFVWMKVFNKIGDLANFSEKVTKRIRLFMAQ
jgi:predicted phosphate transport protein (TIGR00153 family)